jgi:hypothetical protein
MRHAQWNGSWSTWLLLALVGGPLGCGGDTTGGDGSVAAGNLDGGAADRPAADVHFGGGLPSAGMADLRFVNVFAPGGDRSALDLSVQGPDGWQRLTSSLAYGAATAHLSVPVPSFGDTSIVITAPGGDPAMVPRTADRFILLTLTPGDRRTVFFFDHRDTGQHAPMPSNLLEWSDFGDRAAAFTAPAGMVLIQGVKQTIESNEFFWSWALQGMGCLGGGDGLNNEQAKLAPGTYVVSGADDNMPGCIGPTLIMPVTITAAAGSTYFVFPVGEDMADLKMVALPAVP